MQTFKNRYRQCKFFLATAQTLVIVCATIFFSFTLRGDLPCEVVALRSRAPFPVGIAVNTDKLKYEEKYWELALKHFNSFTPEKVLKPQYIHPRKDHYDFWEPDHLIDFCREQKIRLHGHALVWHEATPEWMERFEGSAAGWDSLLKDHIQTIVKHCSHYIRSWDVVNEAFLADGSLRENIWKRNLGAGYIESAFRYAREADKDALLFYNDFGLENNGEKLDKVLAFLEDLKTKGVTVDGIGLQMHVGLQSPTAQNIGEAARRIAGAGYLVHFSEVDVSRAGESTLLMSGKKLRQMQRERYAQIVGIYTALPVKARFGITLWGVSDNDTWLGEDHVRAKPLLFDGRYRPKPAYCGFLEGLGSK